MTVPGSGHASSVTGGAPITALFPVNADGVSPAVLPPSGGLGHAEGRVFSRSGVLLASVTQVGLLRPPRD
jgi:hypothetical protein